MFLGPDTYNDMLDDPENPGDPIADFSFEGLDIVPEADPSLANSVRKRERAQALIEARRAGIPLNDQYIAKLFIEALDEPEPELALKVEPPPPSKDQLEHQARMEELKLKKMELMITWKARENDSKLRYAQAMESLAKAKAAGEAGELKQLDAQLDLLSKQQEGELKEAEFIQNMILGEQKIEAQNVKNQQQQKNSDS
jgi:hypothetical protein